MTRRTRISTADARRLGLSPKRDRAVEKSDKAADRQAGGHVHGAVYQWLAAPGWICSVCGEESKEFQRLGTGPWTCRKPACRDCPECSK